MTLWHTVLSVGKYRFLSPPPQPVIQNSLVTPLKFPQDAPFQLAPPPSLNPETKKFSIPIVSPFPECPVNRIIWYVAFWSGFFHLACCN